MKYWGRSFSSGNQCHFEPIEAELTRLGVNFQIKSHYLSDGRIQRKYRFPETELSKLPTDEDGPYLPLRKDEGFSIWEMDQKEWDEP